MSALLALSIAPRQSWADKIHDSDDPHGVVYVQTNDYRAGHNAVNAYRRDAAGCLQLLGSYATGGTGVFNFDDRIGPDDHAQEVIANKDHSLLFTVNGGSDDVSVFNINRDGSLTLAHGSPVNSNGIQPVSLGLSGTDLIVVNQDGDPNRPGLQTSTHPNYTEFRVVPNGKLVAIPNSTIELPQMSTPTQALVSPFGVYFFGDLLSGTPFPSGVGSIAPGLLPAAGSALQAFYKNPNQRFTQSPNSPMAPPPDAQAAPTIAQSRYTLGMDAHPYLPVVYVGYVVTNRLGVFTYDALGSLHFVKDVPLGTNDITVCWIKVSPDGRWVFTSNAGSNSIDVFDISGTVIQGSGPLSPMLVQSLPLKVPAGAPASEAQPVPGVFNYPTVSFQIETDPSGRFLYSVAHELVPNNDYPQGNVIHTVQVGQDGKLTEPSCSPVQVTNIPSGAHPQGVVAF
ncbi:MAG TPA: hypothetical protein VHB50_19230 [Bryobacteraceae bacterium]|nr:hypothetical protein [Bryobacteraceae bacterium]